MLVTKSVKVHGDTHQVLKAMKERSRSGSMDEVIRALIKGATGRGVEDYHSSPKAYARLTSFVE